MGGGGAGAGAVQAAHERRPARLARQRIRAAGVVHTGRQHGVELAAQKPLEGRNVDAEPGGHGGGVLACLGEVLWREGGQQRAGLGLGDLLVEHPGDQAPVVEEVAAVTAEVFGGQHLVGVGDRLLVVLQVAAAQARHGDLHRLGRRVGARGVGGELLGRRPPWDQVLDHADPKAPAAAGVKDEQPVAASDPARWSGELGQQQVGPKRRVQLVLGSHGVGQRADPEPVRQVGQSHVHVAAALAAARLAQLDDRARCAARVAVGAVVRGRRVGDRAAVVPGQPDQQHQERGRLLPGEVDQAHELIDGAVAPHPLPDRPLLALLGVVVAGCGSAWRQRGRHGGQRS